MKKLILLLIMSLHFVACQTHFIPQKDEFGIYRLTPGDGQVNRDLYELLALRGDQSQLVVDDESLNTLLKYQEMGKSLLPEDKINCPKLGLWDNPFRSEFHYNKALVNLKAEKWRAALDELENAKKYCEGLDYQSAYHYLRGLAFLGQKQMDSAKEEFQDFLNKAERMKPTSYTAMYTENVDDNYKKKGDAQALSKAKREFKKSREDVEPFLNSSLESPLEPSLEELNIPEPEQEIRFPGQGILKPGGTREKMFFLYPAFGIDYSYEARGTSYLGAMGIFSAHGFHWIPRFSTNSLLGSIYGLTLRHPFYEASSRDLNIEWIAHYSTARRGTVVSDGISSRLEDVEEGADYGVGLGGTKRLTSRLSASAQLDYQYSFLRQDYRALGTGFLSYSLLSMLDLYTGYIQDDYQVGVGLSGIFQIGYNLRHRGLSVQVISISY